MLYNQPDIDAIYSQFITQSKTYWEAFAPNPEELEDKYILVDLMVEFEPYLLGNLIIAKYLQKHKKAKIAGVMRARPAFDRWRGLLHSFGVSEVFFCNSDVEFDKIRSDNLINKLSLENDKVALRHKILDFTIDGILVGDLLYDAYLRDYQLETIDHFNNSLKKYICLTEKYYHVYQRIFHNKNIIATVQGHTVYLMYGMMARLAIQNGAVVYGKKPAASPYAIRRYSKLEELPGFEIGFQKNDFDMIINNNKENALQFTNNLLNDRFHGKRFAGSTPTIGHFADTDKKNYSLEKLTNKLKLAPEKPNVFLFCHAFSDSPHRDMRSLHFDYFEWLEDTLKIVSQIPHVNWIVRPHPADEHYSNAGKVAETACEPYINQYDHIFLSPGDLHTTSVMQIADAIVTTRGHAALEFPAIGVPAIVTGKSNFTSLGFTIEPDTREEYIKLLKNIHIIEKPTQDQMERAQIACLCYFYLNYVECQFVPYFPTGFWRLVDFKSLEFWLEALSAIKTKQVEDDPLYQNFCIQIEQNLPFLMKFNELSRFQNSTNVMTGDSIDEMINHAVNNIYDGKSQQALDIFSNILKIKPPNSDTTQNISKVLKSLLPIIINTIPQYKENNDERINDRPHSNF